MGGLAWVFVGFDGRGGEASSVEFPERRGRTCMIYHMGDAAGRYLHICGHGGASAGSE
jgi:hypothetical protein